MKAVGDVSSPGPGILSSHERGDETRPPALVLHACTLLYLPRRLATASFPFANSLSF